VVTMMMMSKRGRERQFINLLNRVIQWGLHQISFDLFFKTSSTYLSSCGLFNVMIDKGKYYMTYKRNTVVSFRTVCMHANIPKGKLEQLKFIVDALLCQSSLVIVKIDKCTTIVNIILKQSYRRYIRCIDHLGWPQVITFFALRCEYLCHDNM